MDECLDNGVIESVVLCRVIQRDAGQIRVDSQRDESGDSLHAEHAVACLADFRIQAGR